MQYYGDILRKLTNRNTTEICEFFVKKCMVKAKNQATNEAMKRFFMISAVSANDGIKELLERNDLVFSSYWSHRRYFAKVKHNIPPVVKFYLSCILLMLSPQKTLIFQKTGLNEQGLLSLWCDIYKYNESDRKCFNQLVSKSSLNKNGLNMVFTDLNSICHNNLHGDEPDNLPCNDKNRDFLLSRVCEDVYILTQRLRGYRNFGS
jgi:hypothetical protein